MFCKNCGNEMDPNAAFCVHCGAMKGVGTRFCANCGTENLMGGSVCTKCGYFIAPPPGVAGEQKSKVAAGLLGIFLGSLGIHNFYLGYKGKALAQLLITLCTCGMGSIVTSIWGLIEGVLILTGSIATDANGVPLKD